LANYNIDHYTKFDFDIETQNLNNNTLLVVRSLNDKEQGLIYFRSVIKQRSVFEALKNIKYVNFLVSSTNFRAITAEGDYADYLKFFIKNYSRFITSDFSDEVLPDPEELLAKAQQEENQLQEKGSFVAVAPTGSGLDIYSNEDTGSQNFVIAVNTPKANLKPLITAFTGHNRDMFKLANLNISQSQIADYQLMVVGKFKSKTEAIDYFAKSLANRKLFRSLDTLSYRNFIITDNNLKKMAETRKIQEYLNFFKVRYIDPSSGAAATQSPTKPAYSGPYNSNIDGTQSFVIVVPKEEVKQDELTAAITRFNQKNYAGKPLVVVATMLDDFRLMIKVDGIANAQAGIEYLRAIAADDQVYGPIQDANYRNFVITPENEKVFRQNKNILTYMEFYKQFYLKQ
jgi:hypothetical protein